MRRMVVTVVMLVGACLAPQLYGAGEWAVELGAGLYVDRVYPGSDDRYIAPVPTANMTYQSGEFRYGLSLMDGLSAEYINPEMKVVAGLSLNAGERREPDEYSAAGVRQDHSNRTKELLAGSSKVSTSVKTTALLGYLSPAGILSVTAAYHPTEVSPEHSSGEDVTEHGFLYSFVYTAELPVRERLSLAWLLGIEFMDQSYADAWYSIDSATESVEAFAPKAGLRDAQIALEVKYDISERVGLSLLTAATIFLGDARRCPYTVHESQETISLEVFYRF